MIGKFINAWLKQDADVTALVGSGTAARIYPGGAPQKTIFPFVTYRETEGKNLGTLRRRSMLNRSRVLLECWGRGSGGYSAVQALALAIHGTDDAPKLDRYAGTLAGIRVQSSRLDEKTEDAGPPEDASDDFLYRVSMTFTIHYEE